MFSRVYTRVRFNLKLYFGATTLTENKEEKSGEFSSVAGWLTISSYYPSKTKLFFKIS